MDKKAARSVSIIGGADGPTSIFIVGKGGKEKNIFRRIKNRLRNERYDRKRKKAQKRIVPGAHTMEETAAYIEDRYGAKEASSSYRSYDERKKQMKCSLLQRERPELFDKKPEITPIKDTDDIRDREKLNQWERQIKEQVRYCEETAAQVPDEEFPIDYHIYIIDRGDEGHMEIETENNRQIFGISWSGKKEIMSSIAKDIYLYYGVTKEDIENRSERYQSLVTELAD